MKTGAKKVLFISHEASRSGAPIVLLHLLKWLKKNTALTFEILLLADGPLKPEFEQLGKTFLLSDITRQHTYRGRVSTKLLGTTPADQHKKVAAYFSKREYQLIYGNTIASLPLLKIFKENHDIKTLCCVHELSYVLNYFFEKDYLHKNLKQTDIVIAVSGAVKNCLINEFNIPAEKVQLHYEFIDTDNAIKGNNNINKAKIGVTGNEFIIGMGGTPEWRKGTDLIIPLAVKLAEQYPVFKFKIVWLGAGDDNGFVKQIRYDADKLGINNQLVFLESKPNPLEFINLFDVFVLLSREDPFPLIVLEAAFLKKPVLAFENSGGIPELIALGAGLSAPYMDLEKMASTIYTLSQDTALMHEMGQKGHQLVLAQYSANVVSPDIYHEINKLIDPEIEKAV